MGRIMIRPYNPFGVGACGVGVRATRIGIAVQHAAMVVAEVFSRAERGDGSTRITQS